MPACPSFTEVMDIDCETVKPDVVMPFSAKRIEARSELERLMSHSGNVENESTFSASFWACSLVIMAVVLLSQFESH